MNLIAELRDYLIAQGVVRAPDQAGPGARPWLPVAWKHPDNGAIAPGDAADSDQAATAQDDGLVVSLMRAPGIPPAPGSEERRIDGVDIVFRSNAVPPVDALEAQIRELLVGSDPGSRTDWQMAGLYVIQSVQYRAYQPIEAANGIFTFVVGYTFELRAT